MEDFTNPAYFKAVWAACVYGLQVLVVMGVVSSVLVFAGGASATKNWQESEAH